MTPPRFSTGSEVVVRTLGKTRGVIVEAGRQGHYRVRVGSVTTWCRDEDLEPSPEISRTKASGRQRPAASPVSDAREPAVARLVDLHGLRVEEAMARAVDEIDRALRDGAVRLDVLHGKGSGRIKDALHRQLASMQVVASFGLDPDNPGVTRVYFA